jgi:hypothetical protein
MLRYCIHAHTPEAHQWLSTSYKGGQGSMECNQCQNSNQVDIHEFRWWISTFSSGSKYSSQIHTCYIQMVLFSIQVFCCIWVVPFSIQVKFQNFQVVQVLFKSSAHMLHSSSAFSYSSGSNSVFKSNGYLHIWMVVFLFWQSIRVLAPFILFSIRTRSQTKWLASSPSLVLVSRSRFISYPGANTHAQCSTVSTNDSPWSMTQWCLYPRGLHSWNTYRTVQYCS